MTFIHAVRKFVMFVGIYIGIADIYILKNYKILLQIYRNVELRTAYEYMINKMVRR